MFGARTSTLMRVLLKTTFRVIDGTDDGELYYTFRYGLDGFTYKIPAADLGVTRAEEAFQVTLHFCDVRQKEAGARIMDVIAQDELILDDLDVVVAAGGRRLPYTASFDVSVVAGSSLKLHLAPVVLAIEIFKTLTPKENE